MAKAKKEAAIEPLAEVRKAPTKVWGAVGATRNHLAADLNRLTAEGNEIFAVTVNPEALGSYFIVYYKVS